MGITSDSSDEKGGKEGKSAAKKKKSRKSKDGSWHKQSDSSRKKKFFPHKVENLLSLMGVATSPVKKAGLLNSSPSLVIALSPQKTPLEVLSPSKLTLSTPTKGPQTSSVTSPGGTQYLAASLIECDDGMIGTFLPTPKASKKELPLPAPDDKKLKEISLNAGEMDGLIDIPISKATILAARKQAAENKKMGKDPRGESQTKVVGISAPQALAKAGIAIIDGFAGQWLHFIPAAFIGKTGQVVKNMGLGGNFENGKMELVNSAISNYLMQTKDGQTIYLSAIPKWVKNYEKIRLLEQITYIIRKKPGDSKFIKFIFRPLSLDRVCPSEIPFYKKAIVNKLRSFVEGDDDAENAADENIKPLPIPSDSANAAALGETVKSPVKSLAAEDKEVLKVAAPQSLAANTSVSTPASKQPMVTISPESSPAKTTTKAGLNYAARLAKLMVSSAAKKLDYFSEEDTPEPVLPTFNHATKAHEDTVVETESTSSVHAIAIVNILKRI